MRRKWRARAAQRPAGPPPGRGGHRRRPGRGRRDRHRKPRPAAASEQRSNDRLAVKALVISCVAVGIVALALFLWYSVQVILLIFAGILIAILLRGLADWVSESTRLPHLASLTIVLVVLVGLIGGFFWIAAPQLVTQIGELAEKLPDSFAQLRASGI